MNRAAKRIRSLTGRRGRAAEAVELPAPRLASGAEYSIDELARAVRTTVRNIRAYQDRGLIPPPERRGRAGVYGEGHVARLRVIGQMLNRGYSLGNIAELFSALEQGQDVAHLLGLESAVTSPWTDELPVKYSLAEIMKMFGGKFKPMWLAKAVELGVLKVAGSSFVAPSPRLLYAGSELSKAGIPMNEMLDLIGSLRRNVERVTDDMVRLVEHYVFDRFGLGMPPPNEVPKLSDLVWRLRPLVEMAVHAEVARAMERAAVKHLGDRLAYVLDHLHDTRD